MIFILGTSQNWSIPNNCQAFKLFPKSREFNSTKSTPFQDGDQSEKNQTQNCVDRNIEDLEHTHSVNSEVIYRWYRNTHYFK